MIRLEQLRLDVIRAGFWLRPWWKVTRVFTLMMPALINEAVFLS